MAVAAKPRNIFAKLLLPLLLFGGLPSPTAQAFTASKVWYEVLPAGLIRVHVAYTIPDLKEFRESYAEFRDKKAADAFYWDLLRGADFYLGDQGLRRFVQQPLAPTPW